MIEHMIHKNMPYPERTTDFCHEISQWAYDLYTNKGYEVIFATVHGSHLYGTAHSDSDIDLYVVVQDGIQNQKKYEDDTDIMLIDLKNFFIKMNEGAHQAVEALCSPYSVWNEESYYTPMVKRVYPTRTSFVRKCLSATKSFRKRVEDGEKGNITKILRHADRLEQSAILMMNNNYSPIYQKFDK